MWTVLFRERVQARGDVLPAAPGHHHHSAFLVLAPLGRARPLEAGHFHSTPRDRHLRWGPIVAGAGAVSVMVWSVNDRRGRAAWLTCHAPSVPELVVLAEQLLAPVPGGTGRYTRELLTAMARTTPEGWTLTAVTAYHHGSTVDARMLPLPRRALTLAWERG